MCVSVLYFRRLFVFFPSHPRLKFDGLKIVAKMLNNHS